VVFSSSGIVCGTENLYNGVIFTRMDESQKHNVEQRKGVNEDCIKCASSGGGDGNMLP
jgi:hypothetical protein